MIAKIYLTPEKMGTEKFTYARVKVKKRVVVGKEHVVFYSATPIFEIPPVSKVKKYIDVSKVYFNPLAGEPTVYSRVVRNSHDLIEYDGPQFVGLYSGQENNRSGAFVPVISDWIKRGV